MFYDLYLNVHSAQHCAVIRRQLDQLGYMCAHQRWPDDEITNIQTFDDGTYHMYRYPFRVSYPHVQINAKQLREKHGRIGSIKSQDNQSTLAVRTISIFGNTCPKSDGVIKVVHHEISLANKVVRFFAKGVEFLRVLTKRIVKYFK